MRLSHNLVIRGFATVYVEMLRNIPLLLQLFSGTSLFYAHYLVGASKQSFSQVLRG